MQSKEIKKYFGAAPFGKYVTYDVAREEEKTKKQNI